MGTDDLMYASEEDINFFHKCTEGLPGVEGFSKDGKDSNGEPMPYGTGPHSVRCLREIVEITKPTSIIEIGLNAGYSSAMWLELSSATVLSCDISDRSETIKAGEILQERYSLGKHSSRFNFVICDSAKLIEMDGVYGHDFDLIFIDGGHLYEHVMADIALALELGIKWLAFDDWLTQFGPGVQPAIAQHPQLEQVKIMGNIALFKNTEV